MEIRIEHYLEHLSESVPLSHGIIFEDKVLNYSEFNILCNQLSHFLLNELNQNKQNYVGIFMDRSLEMLLAIFATLKAGAAYVPIDPQFPESRVKLMIENAEISTVITQNKHSNSKSLVNCNLIVADITDWAYHDQAEFNPQKPEVVNKTAYILFTSGSTGTPKGAMLGHHSVVNLLNYMQKEYPLEKQDVILFKSPFTFDGSVWEIFGWLLPKCKLCIALPGIEKDPAALLKTLVKFRINFAFFVSSMLSVFIDYLEIAKPDSADFSIKWMSVGGEVVTPQLVKRFYQFFDPSKCGLINVYGPTETCVYATTHYCRHNVEYAKVPVGKPVDNDLIYILDKDLNLTESGKEGEIFIGGRGVALGYLRQQELTAEKFLSDPNNPGGIMYRTGDLGIRMPNGELDFIGRTDFQVKLRGLRIEPGEIEHAILKIDGIKETVVEVRKNQYSIDQLVSFIVRNKSDIQSVSQPRLLTGDEKRSLIEMLSKMIPGYMVPDEFVEYHQFPLTFNGKTDRKYLQLPVDEYINIDEPLQNFSGLKGKLESIWKRMLKQKEVNEQDDFFMQGGHSLTAASMSTLILKETGLQIGLSDIFNNPRFGDLAACLISRESEVSVSPLIEKIIRTNTGYPVQTNQKELWILHKMDETGTQHNIVFRLDIDGNADFERFNKALNFTIKDFEVLRTSFSIENQELNQFIAPEFEYKMTFHDFRRLNALDAQIMLDNLIQNTGKTRLLTGKLPLFGFEWVQLTDKEVKLIFLIHHLIFDGGSMFPFFNSIKSHYIQLNKSEHYISLSPDIQNIDISSWRKTTEENQIRPGSADFWMKQFNVLPTDLKLNFRKTAEKDQTARLGNRFWWTIQKDTINQLKSLSSSESCSLFALLIACYKINLMKHSGNRDIVVGTPFANRLLPEEEKLVGYYTNMVALRDQINPNQSFISQLKAVQQTNLNSFSHADVPFGALVKKLGINRLPGEYPLFQVIFVMQNWEFPDMEFEGIEIKQKELGSNAVKAELYLNAEETEEGMELWVEYDTALYELHDIEAFAEDFNLILANVLTNPKSPVSEISGIAFNQVVKIPEKPNCLVIGETTLLIKFCETITNQGFEIKAIVSPDHQCTLWADRKGIPFLNSYHSSGIQMIQKQPYDFIFSIVNSKILGNEILKLARIGVINYHDSLLPQNAGLFASSWAILQNQQKHGISWHKVTPEIDTGDIYIQKTFNLESGDSAGDINLKSYEVAVQSFKELLQIIKSEAFIPLKQDLTHRSYNGKYDRPNSACFIDFGKKSLDIYRLCLACDLGLFQYNEFGLPRLVVSDELYIVKNVAITDCKKTAIPGTVLATGASSLTIATAENAVILNSIYTPDGLMIPIDRFIQKHKLITGCIMEQNIISLTNNFNLQGYKKIIKNESFWIEKLLKYQPVVCPIITPENKDKSANVLTTIRYSIPINSFEKLILDESDENARIILAAAVALFVGKLNNSSPLILPVSSDYQDSPLISKFVPVEFRFDKQRSFQEQRNELVIDYLSQMSNGSFFMDIFMRHPELAARQPGTRFSDCLFSVILTNDKSTSVRPDQNESIDFLTGNKSLEIIFTSDFSVSTRSAYDYMVHHFEFFLNKLQNPHTPIKSLNLLTNEDCDNLVHNQCKTPIQADENLTVTDLFYNQLNSMPHKVAVIQGNVALTYAELDKKSSIYCEALLNKGLRQGSIVGILSERSPLMIAGLLGIIKAGGAWLPIDVSFPELRLNEIINASGVEYALVSAKTGPYVEGKIQNLIYLEKQLDIPPAHISVKVKNEDPAYIIYTSGSSGKPKGVEISHKALFSFTFNAIKRYGIAESDRVLQFATLTFDTAVEEIFITLCAGATLVLRNNENTISVQELMEIIKTGQITVLDLPTAYWQELITAIVSGGLSFPESIRLLIIGGEAAQPHGIQLWKQNSGKNIRLLNTYGPTETTVVAACCFLDEEEPNDVFPIGIAIGDTELYVVDSDLNPVLPLIPGQLLIGGPQLATRYVGDEELTNKRFIKNLFSNNADSRLYLTGDLVTRTLSGSLVYLGRIDNQVKIRGFRIEPSEIDHVLSASGLIQISVTKADHSGDIRRLVSYVVPKSFHPDIKTELLDYLNKNLPDYMIPSAIVLLESFPLNRNMKIDISSLPSPVFEENSEEAMVLSETENILKAIYLQVLKIKRCSISSSFFNLGGDSLLALSLVARIREVFGSDLPIAKIYENPAIRQLAFIIDQLHAEKITLSLPEIADNHIVQLQIGIQKPPVFSIFLDSANGWLPSMLGKGQAFYTFIPQGSDGDRIIYKTVESMAAAFIESLIKIYPETQIHLIGYSFGGLVALEMAIQLKKMNLSLLSLTLIDTVAPEIWRNMLRHTEIETRIKRIIKQLKTKAFFISGKKLPLSLRNGYILHVWRKAAYHYRPVANPGIIDFKLIRSSHSLSDYPKLGWESWPSLHVDVTIMEGDHHSIIRQKESVIKIADWMKSEVL